jgi:phosphatidylglycerol:prolipoprotein diacylglycerol transferase
MHPDLFTIHFHGAHTVHTYGVMLLIGFVLALWRAIVVGRQMRSRHANYPISTQDVMDVSVAMLLSGIFFARIVFVLLDPHHYALRDVLAIWNGGITFDGGLFGGLLAIYIYTLVRRIPLMLMLDMLAPASIIGYAIGRIGCFFNGCCYGAPTTLPWGVRFPEIDANGFPYHTPPSHPAQLYSTITSTIILVLLSMKQRSPKTVVGEVFSWYLIASGIDRFIMEIFRAGVTSDLVAGTPFTMAQFFCFFLIACGIIGLIASRKRNVTVDEASVPRVAPELVPVTGSKV